MLPVAASLRLTSRILPLIAFVLLASCRGLSYAVFAACRHMSPYRIDAVFCPHDGADSLRCRRDPSLLLRVRQVPGSYTRPDSRVSLLGCSRCAMVLSRVYVLDAR